jgi:hypothetical protein
LASLAAKIEGRLQGSDGRPGHPESSTSREPNAHKLNIKPLNFDKNKNVSFQNEDGEPSTPSINNLSIQDLSFQGPNQVFDWQQQPQGHGSPDRLLETFGNAKGQNANHSFGNQSFDISFQLDKKILQDSVQGSIQGDRNSFYPSPEGRQDHIFLNPDNEPKLFNLETKKIPSYRRLIDEQVLESSNHRISTKNVPIDEDFGMEREQSLTKNPSPQISSLTPGSSSKRQIPIEVTSADDGLLTSDRKIHCA